MREQIEIEGLFHSLIRNKNITVSNRQKVEKLIKLGKEKNISVEYQDYSNNYGESYEVFLNERTTVDPRFNRLRYESDSISCNVKLDPRNEALARNLLKGNSVESTNIEELLKEALFSYANQKIGKEQVDEIFDAVNENYIEEY